MFLHVQEVEPGSPAAMAGLRAHTDYIIGTDTLMNEVRAPHAPEQVICSNESRLRVDSVCALPPDRRSVQHRGRARRRRAEAVRVQHGHGQLPRGADHAKLSLGRRRQVRRS